MQLVACRMLFSWRQARVLELTVEEVLLCLNVECGAKLSYLNILIFKLNDDVNYPNIMISKKISPFLYV